MERWLNRLFDLRKGESRPALLAFVVLFLIIGAHTMLETARDALFLSMLPPRQLNIVYIALAGLSLFVSFATTRLAAAFGRRNTLIVTLGIAAFSTTLLYSLTLTPRVAMTLYVTSGLLGGALSLQFWLLSAQMFTSAQGRRLFGPIASGGVLGGLAGAGSAAALLTRASVSSLLIVASLAFVVTALVLTGLPAPDAEPVARRDPMPRGAPARPSLAFAEQPFVWRVALLVATSTAAVLTLDYLFKSTAARVIPMDQLGHFFARYYAVMNGVSLLVQLLLAGRLVRRLGVAGATAVMPALLFGGGVASLLAAGALLPVMAARMSDGGLRHSLNRVATELLYLPMPVGVRERAKGLIDSVLTRVVQAVTAGMLFAVASGGMLSPRALSAILVGLCAVWGLTALGMRTHYLDLFRRSLARGTLELDSSTGDIDVNAAEALVEAMASRDPKIVVASLDVLEQRNRTKLIPALILYHEADVVLFRALEIFGASRRSDWIPLAERLLSHAREAVRVAAIRALARHGATPALALASEDVSSVVQAYAAFHIALRSDEDPLTEHPRLAVLLKMPGEFGDASRRGLLAAIADSPDPRAVLVVKAIVEARSFRRTQEAVTLAAQAMAALKDPRYIPFCIAQLAFRPGREAVRRTLTVIGEPALAALEAALLDRDTDRRVRLHIPRTISRFGSQRAADILLTRLEKEREGLARYKALRALGGIVAEHDVKIDRSRIDALAKQNLVRYLRMTACLAGLGSAAEAETLPAEELLVGLVRDKQSQSLERAFRLLKIAHKREDIHRVHVAVVSDDRRARSNAGEFLDSLLAGRNRGDVRTLFRLVAEDLEPAERAARAAGFLGTVPRTRDEVLATLIDDPDESLATIASYCALSGGAGHLRASVERARLGRPSLDTVLQRFLGGATAGEVPG